MKKSYKVYIENGGDYFQFTKWFSIRTKIVVEHLKFIDDGSKPDLIIFTGGADVDPELYGHKISRTTQMDRRRDEECIDLYNFAVENKIPMIGICRGAQFLTVAHGGKLVQHINGHAIGGQHLVTTKDGAQFYITSSHHQMMFPFLLDENKYELLGWSTKQLSNTYLVQDDVPIDPKTINFETEIVYYPETKTLAIQGHPEWMGVNDKANIWLSEKIKDLVL